MKLSYNEYPSLPKWSSVFITSWVQEFGIKSTNAMKKVMENL